VSVGSAKDGIHLEPRRRAKGTTALNVTQRARREGRQPDQPGERLLMSALPSAPRRHIPRRCDGLRGRGNLLRLRALAGVRASFPLPQIRHARRANSRYVSNAHRPLDVNTRRFASRRRTAVVTLAFTIRMGFSSCCSSIGWIPARIIRPSPERQRDGRDAVAGDGIFSATIPGRQPARWLHFMCRPRITLRLRRRPGSQIDAPVRECLMRVGEKQPTGNYPVYRVWMTQAILNT